MKLPGGLGHLTYSTLVHPADTWDAALGQRQSLSSGCQTAG